MKKLGFALLLIFFGLAAWAGGPWTDKPYQQWTQQDVNKVLMDSPWAQIISVDAPWLGVGFSGSSERGAGSGASQGAQSQGPGSGGPAGTPQPVTDYTGSTVQKEKLLVRWNSSHTVREAIARQAVLSGQFKQEEADKFVADAVDSYQVLVGGVDMSQFEGLDENTLTAKATLNLKKTKQTLTSTKVTILRKPGGSSVSSVLYDFPMKTAGGEPTIPPTEKTLEFSCRARDEKVVASFDWKKMVDADTAR